MKRNERSQSSWKQVSQEAKTALCMLVLLLTMQSVAAFQYEGIEYTINDDGWSVTATGFGTPSIEPTTLIIPDYAWDNGKAYAVTVIQRNAFDSPSLKNFRKLVVGDNVTTIGSKAFEHFGEAPALHTIIMGKSVTALDSKAFEHFGERPVKGLQNTVILKGEDPAKINKQTFEHMRSTTIYVKDEATYNRYIANSEWKGYDYKNNNKRNRYEYPIPADITLKGDLWQTAVFPEDLSQTKLDEYFGEGTKVAKLHQNKHQWDGKDEYVVRFDLQEGVKRNEPVLIKPANKDNHYVSEVSYGVDSYEKNPSVTMTDTENNWKVIMIGICNDDHKLDFGQMYLRNQDGTMHFYMAENDANVWVKRGKCIFEMRDANTGELLTDVKITYDIQQNTTAIQSISGNDRTDKAGVYTLAGQYVGSTMEGLAKGFYIVNGRKVIVK